ncbi:HAMP domain-containing histidine kinase [Eubacteriales bacterium OttesenSCG-928-K08]|nr:HAMP domain-containing histidine kinase [Eubacteriales bacterium OttesenSCG-928-K08]
MRSFFASIRFRMVAIYLLVMVFAFIAVSSIVSAIVGGFLVTQRVQDQSSETLELSIVLAPLYQSNDAVGLYHAAADYVQSSGARVLVMDEDAVVQMDTASQYNGYRLPYREVRDILVNNEESSYGFHKIEKEAYQEATGAPVTEWVVYYTARFDGGVVLCAESIQDVEDGINNVTRQIGLVFGVFAVAVALISLMISRWLTQPILTLTNAIRHMGAHGYSERVPVKGQGEIARLSEAFNTMSEQLENHDRVRNDFVSNASHELKTPLSTIKILAETMLYQENPDPDMSREFFEDINHEVDRLNRITNDLLQLVREDNAPLVLKTSKVDMEALIQRVIKRLLPIAKKKGIRLEKKLSPVIIDADEMRIDQIITNLIDNALKYTDKGSVSVLLKPDGAYAVIAVHDTGIGIPKETIPRIFERFYRVDKARSRDTGGTGLGLAIVERIVSQHGGLIQVDSVLGRGTTFTVRLPLTQKQPPAQPEEKQ